MFGHFTTLYMKGLKYLKKRITNGNKLPENRQIKQGAQ